MLQKVKNSNIAKQKECKMLQRKKKNNVVVINNDSNIVEQLRKKIEEKDEIIRLRENSLREITNKYHRVSRKLDDSQRQIIAISNATAYFVNRKVTFRDYLRGYFKKVF